MFSHVPQIVLQKAQAVKLLILDVDGVLTTGQLFITDKGEVIKPFNTLDGHGIRMLQQTGVQTAIITARNDAAVEFRAKQLGITHYYHGVSDKKLAYQQVCELAQVEYDECAMVGDDVIDLPIMIRCGLPIAVANGHDFVKQQAVWVTDKQGGMGAVRQITDMIMYAQGNLNSKLDEYFL